MWTIRLLVNSTSEAASCLDNFKNTAAGLGLRVSWPKTKLQNLSAGTQLPAIVVDGNAVESVDNFVYLGSVFTSIAAQTFIDRASSVMSSLQHIWKDQRLSIATKRTFTMPWRMLSVLVNAAENWSLLSIDSRALEAFHMKCQRQLLQIKWRQFIRNEDISATTGFPSISDTISHRRNALFGHVATLPDDVPAHRALSGHINLSLGRPPSSQWRRTQAVPVADGSINSGQISLPTFHLQTSGGVLSTVVTEGRRYGPCRLSDNNNNNNS